MNIKCYFCNNDLSYAFNEQSYYCKHCPIVEKDTYSIHRHKFIVFCNKNNPDMIALAWNDEDLQIRLNIYVNDENDLKNKTASLNKLYYDDEILFINEISIYGYTPDQLKKKIKSILAFI